MGIIKLIIAFTVGLILTCFYNGQAQSNYSKVDYTYEEHQVRMEDENIAIVVLSDEIGKRYFLEITLDKVHGTIYAEDRFNKLDDGIYKVVSSSDATIEDKNIIIIRSTKTKY